MIIINCILCDNNTNSEIYIQNKNFKIIRCNKCGLFFQYTPVYFESIDNIYNNIYSEIPQQIQDKSYWRKRMKVYYEDVTMYQKKTGNLLDIGCSYGLLMEHFISKGWETTGIDISKNAICYAQSKGLNCYHTSIENFKPKNKFDVIIMSNVLEHLERPLECLLIIKNWLAPSGIIYIRVPNIESIILLSRRQSFIGDLKPFEHLYYFSKDTLSVLLKKTGLKSHIKTGGRVNLGNILNSYFRTKFVLKDSWHNLNYKIKTQNKHKYLLIKHIYGEILSILGNIPLGPKNREIVAFASQENHG